MSIPKSLKITVLVVVATGLLLALVRYSIPFFYIMRTEKIGNSLYYSRSPYSDIKQITKENFQISVFKKHCMVLKKGVFAVCNKASTCTGDSCSLVVSEGQFYCCQLK